MQSLTQRRGGAEGWAYAGVLGAIVMVLDGRFFHPRSLPHSLAGYATMTSASPCGSVFHMQAMPRRLTFDR